MLDALDEFFGDKIEHTRPNGGLFIWCDLGRNINTFELAKKGIENKIAFVPGNSFYTDTSIPRSSLRLNFSSAPSELLREGIRRLSVLFEEEISK